MTQLTAPKSSQNKFAFGPVLKKLFVSSKFADKTKFLPQTEDKGENELLREGSIGGV